MAKPASITIRDVDRGPITISTNKPIQMRWRPVPQLTLIYWGEDRFFVRERPEEIQAMLDGRPCACPSTVVHEPDCPEREP